MSTIADINTEEGMKFAIEWTTGFFAQMEDGAVWVIPRSGAIYDIYPSKKVVVRIHADKPTDLVIKEMKWEIREEL